MDSRYDNILVRTHVENTEGELARRRTLGSWGGFGRRGVVFILCAVRFQSPMVAAPEQCVHWIRFVRVREFKNPQPVGPHIRSIPFLWNACAAYLVE